MTVTTEPRWRRLEHDERRAQILSVARRLFSERSFADVSSEEIAAAAGVRRGLLHHYFGSKRDLYLEVVRELLSRASVPYEHDHTIQSHVERWLDFIDRNKGMWIALSGAVGFGRDHDVEALVAEAADATVDQIIRVLAIDNASDELRAVLRAYGGLAEGTIREWLQRRTITKQQAVALLTTALISLVRDVVPAVEAQ